MGDTVCATRLDTPTWAGPSVAVAARVFSVFAIYGLVSLVLLKAQIFGDRSFFSCCDSSIQSYAWLGKVAAAARHFTIPLWSFSTYAGISFAGELQPGPFYPPTWILGLLGFKGMPLVDSFMVLHFALAASFMHLLLRNIGLTRIAAVAGALIFTFTGYVPLQAAGQPNIYASLVWIPLVFLFYRQAVVARRIRVVLTYSSLAGAAGATQIVAGHLQPFIYTSYALAAYLLVETFPSRSSTTRWSARPLALLVMGQLLAVAFAAVPLALSLQYLHVVYRWYGDAHNGGISTFPHIVSFRSWAESAILVWKDFATLFNPAVEMQEYNGTMFLTLTGLCAAVLTIIRPGRFVVALWIIATASIVIALGGELGRVARITYYMPLLAQTRTPVRAMYLFSFAASALAAIGINRAGQIVGQAVPLAAPLFTTALLVSVAYEVVGVVPSLGMPTNQPQFAPVYYETDPGLAAIERLSNMGPRVDRYIAEPTDLIPPNAGDIKPVMNVLGHRGTMLTSEFDYISQGWGPGASDQLDRLGVRWVISDKPVNGLPLVERGKGYIIYERPHSLSAFWTFDPKTGTRMPAPVQAVHWRENSVDIQLGPITPGLKLVFAQPNFPGWVAFVDHKEVPIGKEEIFSAIDVTNPMRNVTFAYQPQLWPWIMVTLASSIFAALAALSWAYPRQMAPLTTRASAWSKRLGIARVIC